MSRDAGRSSSARYDAAYFARESGYSRMLLRGAKPLYHRRWVRELASYRPEGRLLDLGCGMGYFAAAAVRRWEVWGVDLSAQGLEAARKRCPTGHFEVADLTRWRPPPKAFDVATCFDVLEHLRSPEALLRRARRAMVPGGVLGLTTPNPHSAGREMKSENWFALRDRTHVSIRRPEEWVEAVESAGFDVVREFYDGLWDSPYLRGWPAALQHLRYKLPQALLFGLGWGSSRQRGENLCLVAMNEGEE